MRRCWYVTVLLLTSACKFIMTQLLLRVLVAFGTYIQHTYSGHVSVWSDVRHALLMHAMYSSMVEMAREFNWSMLANCNTQFPFTLYTYVLFWVTLFRVSWLLFPFVQEEEECSLYHVSVHTCTYATTRPHKMWFNDRHTHNTHTHTHTHTHMPWVKRRVMHII